jgi:hypothetical protein
VANVAFVAKFVVDLMNEEHNRLQILQNMKRLSLISLLSILDTELLGIFGSFMTASPITCLTLTDDTKLRLKYSGLIRTFLEDLPQFCIQENPLYNKLTWTTQVDKSCTNREF